MGRCQAIISPPSLSFYLILQAQDFLAVLLLGRGFSTNKERGIPGNLPDREPWPLETRRGKAVQYSSVVCSRYGNGDCSW